MRFLIVPPEHSRPTLVVETRACADESALRELKATIFGFGCPNGIVFDEETCVILRDTFSALDDTSIVEETLLRTVDVIGGGGSLDWRVERWLRALSADWNHALPLEPKIAAPFITDIVPAASGSFVHALREPAR